jgi:hypothetical protein
MSSSSKKQSASSNSKNAPRPSPNAKEESKTSEEFEYSDDIPLDKIPFSVIPNKEGGMSTM